MEALSYSSLQGFPLYGLLGGLSILVAGLTIFLDTYFSELLYEIFPDTWLDMSWRYVSGIVRNIWVQTMKNQVLVALPMFIFMGLMLERSGITERLMVACTRVFGHLNGGFAITVILIGVILAASTGIVGASVVLLALLGLPVMLKNNYNPSLAVGTVTAVGTLGILIPPSIMLVLMADKIAIPVGNLFLGAMIPGFLLGLLYIGYILLIGLISPQSAPAPKDPLPITFQTILSLIGTIIPSLFLILAVLGSIFFGIATPTEASGVGAFGATFLALLNRQLTVSTLKKVLYDTTKTSAFIFAIVLGAIAFAHILRGLDGDVFMRQWLLELALGEFATILIVLLIVFILGFVLDWVQIVLIILPLGAALIGNPSDPSTGMWDELGFQSPVDALTWFTIVFAVVLQTSFLTPPVGYSLFYVRGVAPPEIQLTTIYWGVIPYIVIQVCIVILLLFWRDLVLWLPHQAYL